MYVFVVHVEYVVLHMYVYILHLIEQSENETNWIKLNNLYRNWRLYSYVASYLIFARTYSRG